MSAQTEQLKASPWDTVGGLVTLAAQRDPDRVALRQVGGRERTYGELDSRTTRLANALVDLGLVPGDRVGVWLDTCAEYVEIYIASAKAGLVVVPVNGLLTAHEAAQIIGDCEPRAFFYTRRLAESVPQATAGTSLVVTVEIDCAVDGISVQLEDLINAGATTELPAPAADDLFMLGYTSGTTGLPKGAMLTHRSVLAASHIHAIAYRLPMYSVACFAFNMSFVATITGLVFPHFYVMGTVVLAGPVPDVTRLIDVIDAERCTMVYVPTPWIRPFVELAESRPEAWRQLQTVVHSASKADPADLRALVDLVGPKLVEAFGMTELSGSAIAATIEEDYADGARARDVFDSTGRPTVGCAVRLADEDGQEVVHDGVTPGELVVRSPALMAGYWRRPKESAAVIRDGWYHTGDIGAIDSAGYIYVFERRTDLILSGGMNVYPTEVENVIGRHPDVAAVAVVGLPHAKWGQSPVAVVVREDGSMVDAEAIIEYCRTQLASYKKPSEVRFVDELPRNASNKILRRKIRETLLAEREAAAPTLESA
jgi:acyl-CoA synthetase (AMP-forming)/AMP-acid ligase II